MNNNNYNNIKSLESLSQEDLTGKKVLVRVDFNVPIKDGIVGDTTRLKASLQTINFLVQNNAKVILMSHLGRPKGEKNLKYTLEPVAKSLGELINQEVIFASDCVGDIAINTVNSLNNGQVCLLENLRFYAEEEANNSNFAQALGNLCDIYINDAFGAAHRAHASTAGITQCIENKYMGFLIARELKELGSLLQSPERPFVSIVGGSKVSSKIDILRSLIEKSDVILIGGGMSYTFIKAQGGKIGKSLCEDDKLDLARELLELADKQGTAILLPVDHLAVEEFGSDETPQVVTAGEIPDNLEGLDVGPKSIEFFDKQLALAKTVLWNGPVGVFEIDKFSKGTKAIADKLVEIQKTGAHTVIGGGDSAAAVAKFGYVDQDFGHISTGGGASLEFLSGVTLPGIQALEN